MKAMMNETMKVMIDARMNTMRNSVMSARMNAIGCCDQVPRRPSAKESECQVGLITKRD